MSKGSVIIDCDPGQDDAVNLLLALASPDDFDVLGITTVAGNVPLDMTQRNARIICEIAGRFDVMVFAGCNRPMHRELITAECVHGTTGIDGIEIFEPNVPLESLHATDFIIESLLSSEPESITLVTTGPLTNIATAIEREPAIVRQVREIILMGGAMREGGNFSPSAEFNILVDPESAEIVFNCGRPITAMGLDVTHQVLSTSERIARIRNLHNSVSDAVCDMLEFFHFYDTAKYASMGAPLHDPCTMGYLLKPEIFQGKICNVAVETRSKLTLGHTSVDFWGVSNRPKNVNWIYKVDADAFYELLTDRLALYAG